jgi:hypothetical protein
MAKAQSMSRSIRVQGFSGSARAQPAKLERDVPRDHFGFSKVERVTVAGGSGSTSMVVPAKMPATYPGPRTVKK